MAKTFIYAIPWVVGGLMGCFSHNHSGGIFSFQPLDFSWVAGCEVQWLEKQQPCRLKVDAGYLNSNNIFVVLGSELHLDMQT